MGPGSRRVRATGPAAAAVAAVAAAAPARLPGAAPLLAALGPPAHSRPGARSETESGGSGAERQRWPERSAFPTSVRFNPNGGQLPNKRERADKSLRGLLSEPRQTCLAQPAYKEMRYRIGGGTLGNAEVQHTRSLCGTRLKRDNLTKLVQLQTLNRFKSTPITKYRNIWLDIPKDSKGILIGFSSKVTFTLDLESTIKHKVYRLIEEGHKQCT